ncbi:MAG: SDR family NAD(P)-dependent oxidoreductase [Bacteroidota bacterium]
MAAKKYDNPVTATLSGIFNMFKKTERFGNLSDDDRLDGKTVMITGANSGLGFATAERIAKLGAKVIMACRSGIPEAGEHIKKLSSSDNIEMESIDLADVDSILSLCDRLEAKNEKIDILINNAAVVPGGSKRTPQGLEQMFMVNYLAHFILINELLKNNTIPNKVFGGNSNPGNDDKSRIIMISSESHRSGDDLDLNKLGIYEDFKMSKVVSLYGYYKLALSTFTAELDRRLNVEGFDVSVHSICPGAVNSNIARDAPKGFQPLLKVVFKLFFQDPMKASEPVVYLASSSRLHSDTGHYLHMWAKKDPDIRSIDEKLGKQLWERSEQIVASIL